MRMQMEMGRKDEENGADAVSDVDNGTGLHSGTGGHHARLRRPWEDKHFWAWRILASNARRSGLQSSSNSELVHQLRLTLPNYPTHIFKAPDSAHHIGILISSGALRRYLCIATNNVTPDVVVYP